MTESLPNRHALATTQQTLGILTLERPRALNSLDTPMVRTLQQALDAWRDDPQVAAVAIHGAGERGLCAGGDIRMMRTAIIEGRPEEAMEFWREEYAMDGTIATYPKPYVAFMDGITMGGGIGVSAHGSVRLATERTQVAMPETIIGFFPDVGALHLLSRAPGELGAYLALTGTTIDGWDAVDVGLADAVIDSATWPAILDALRDGEPATLDALTQGRTLPRPADRPGILATRAWVDEAFAGDDPVAIVHRLEGSALPEARAAAELVRARSPWSVHVALAALRRAATMTVQQVLAQDLHLCEAVLTSPDFPEGVRAQVVDKDRNPRWQHAGVEDVDPAEIAALF